jgi:ribosomal protein S26
MSKNVRRGRTGNVRCASCGQLTRRDRSVYLFRDGIKSYYCPDCAKKIHGPRLYKGMPRFVRRPSVPKTKRKFTVYSSVEDAQQESVQEITPAIPPSNPQETEVKQDDNQT